MHLSKCSSTSLLITLKSFIMWSMIDIQIDESRRQWKRKEEKRSKEQEAETYLWLLKIVQLSMRALTACVMFHGHQRAKDGGGRRE